MDGHTAQLFISTIATITFSSAFAASMQRFVTTARSACRAVNAARQSVIMRQAFQLRTVTIDAPHALGVAHNYGQAHSDYRGARYAAVAAGLALAGLSQQQTAHAEEDLERQQLLKAARKGDLDGVRRLLRLGAADINACDQDGRTVLHWVTCCRESGCWSYSRVVRCLIKGGVDLNGQESSSGATPLHLAIEGRRWDMVRVLLAAGVRTNLKNRQGSTPRDLMSNGYPHRLKWFDRWAKRGGCAGCPLLPHMLGIRTCAG